VPDDADWRLRGQERYLQGATLVRKPYQARSEEWEHDHCEFCWTKFRDMRSKAAAPCAQEFAHRFDWTVLEPGHQRTETS